MENIIDGILNSEKLSPKELNSFFKKYSIDKSNRSNFKDSLTKAKERLTSERDKIFIPDSHIIRGDNPFTQWGEFYSKHRKTERVYPRGTDEKKVSSDKKRKKELSREISLIDRMLQRVDLYPEKESSQIKENNSPGLMEFEEPLKSKIEEINRMIYNSELGGVSEKKIKSDIKFHLERFFFSKDRGLAFTGEFNNYETFIRRVFLHLKFTKLKWGKEQFVKTLSNKFRT